LTIAKADNVYDFRNFKLEVPTRFGVIYDSVVSLMEDQVGHPNSLCIDCIYKLSDENDLAVNTVNVEDNLIIITLRI